MACYGVDAIEFAPQMSIFDHASARRPKPGPTIEREARLAPGMAILAIGVLSLLSWGILISIAMVFWSAF